MLQLGLIGYPLGHSLSPVIHGAAMRDLGLEGEYRLYPTLPLPAGEREMEGLLQRVSSGELQGLNVTIPHKQAVLRWIDELSGEARDTGAVNTIYYADGHLAGDNTDVAGFMHDLSNQLPVNISNGRAIVLGAGGSARAVVYALRRIGWGVIIAARRVSQAEELINDIVSRNRQMDVIELSAARLEAVLNSTREPNLVNLIVNTTPVGMAPNVDDSPWPDGVPFPPEAFVYDLVYNPLETRLVNDARRAGLEACNGLGMLVEQAALSFERWTGLTAPRQSMMEAAMKSQSERK